MNKYTNFNFEKYFFDYNKSIGHFYYNFDEKIFFEEVIDFHDNGFKIRQNLDERVIDNMMFNIHLALGVSYYKFYLSDNLIIRTGKLDEEDINFWKKFYINGLGEFLYTNKLSIKNKFNFVIQNNTKKQKIDFETSLKSLVAIGGGKDSIVSIELLKSFGEDFDLFTFSSKDNVLYQNTIEISGKKRLFIKRELSKNILEIIKSGRYNGHVPITGIIAFVSILRAYLYDYKYIILSNEFSANFGNTTYEGIEINHQYSKSLEFEIDFSKYIEKNISSNIHYFSLLRGFYEIKIASLFAKYAKKYFPFFSSCNTNFKIFDKEENKENKYWCLSCPKCVFVYIILRPFITEEENKAIFGRELYLDLNLKNLFLELSGFSSIKPFECVGTLDEVKLAIKMFIDKTSLQSEIINFFKEKLKDLNVNFLQNKYFLNQENNIPQYFLDKIKNIELGEKK